MKENELTEMIIGCAIAVHRELGPGFLESAYQECLAYELQDAGLKVKREVPMPVVYKDVKLDHGYRIDLLVENQIVVELKTVEALTDVHKAQVLTYLRLGDFRIGLLFNFNSAVLVKNMKRIII
jgi:GxxExxY protein